MLATCVILIGLKYCSDVNNYVINMPHLPQANWFITDNVTGKVIANVATEATASIPAVITVEATANFSARIRQFILQFSDVRRRTWQSRGTGEWKERVHYLSLIHI